MFQCNKIILGVKGHRENHWSVEIICTAKCDMFCIVQIVSFNVKVPLNQCALRALSRVAAIFTYIEISALRVLAISEDFLHYVNELGSGVLRNHHIIKALYVFGFFLLWSVSGRMSRSPPKRGRPPRNEKNKTILLRESTLKPKEMLLLFINECQ